MKKFELFMCCLGNGVTVCNSAVRESGDFKQVAHIARCGKITWYVNPQSYIPADDLEKIKHCAHEECEEWEGWLDSMPKSQQYEKLLDAVPYNVALYAMGLGGGIEQKIIYLKNVCYEKSYF